MQDFSREEDTPIIPLIVMRIEAPTRDLDEFIVHYCRYFAQDVMFLPTEGFQPPGRRVRFTFALADGREVVWGEGIVLRMRRDSGDPQRPPGMELHYSVLDEASQRIVDQMLALRLSGTAIRRPDPPPYVSMWLGPTREAAREPEPPAAPAPSRASVPANPFWDVPTRVLHDFVDWAFDRMSDHTERMRLPPLFDQPAPADPAPGAAQRLWFAVGTGAVVLALLAVGLLAFRATDPVPANIIAPQQQNVATQHKNVAPQQNSRNARGIPSAPPSVSEPPRVPAPAPRPAAARLVPLSIAVTAAGAWVTVDDQPRRRAPFTVDVAPGPHAVTVERPRYATAHLQVQAPGELEVPLVRPIATLVIRSTAPGVEVRIDGHPAGRTPLERSTTAYEQHRIDTAHQHRRVYLRPPVSVVELKPHAR